MAVMFQFCFCGCLCLCLQRQLVELYLKENKTFLMLHQCKAVLTLKLPVTAIDALQHFETG